jgi:hypothetical protein
LSAELIVKHPIPQEEIQRLTSTIGVITSKKPIAFIFGHGLWNNLEIPKTTAWIDEIINAIQLQLPYLTKPNAIFPRLFVTPSASGKQKPELYEVTQGNRALMLFEDAMRIEAAKRRIEHLGTWNMSIQSNKYDGVHLDMKGTWLRR